MSSTTRTCAKDHLAESGALEFREVDYGEPHRLRRRVILREHPEVRELFGFDRRTSAVIGLVVALHLGVAAVLQVAADSGHWLGSWWSVVAVAAGGGAILSHWLSMGIHECSHNLAARRPVTNRIVAMIANIPMLVPAAMSFYRYHIAHHTYLGVKELDTDLAQRFEMRLVGTSRVRKFLVLLFFPALYLVRGLMFMEGVDRWEVLNAVIQIVANVLIVAFVGWVAWAYLFVSFWIGHGIHPVAAHFVHEHYVFEEPQETYSYYGPLNLVTFNVGYHYEHHDLMNIPGSRLPEYRQRTAAHYDDLVSHASWTSILCRYVLDERLGPHTRIVRGEPVFRRERSGARRELTDR